MTRSIRFQPDPLDHAMIDFNFEAPEFVPQAIALIMNESYTGCNLIVKTSQTLKANQNIKTQVGKLGIIPARIAWVKLLEPSLYQVGVQFL